MISLFSTLHSSPGVCVCFLHQHQSSILFGHVACQIPVPCPGIELKAPAVEVRRVNHWTTRKLLAPEFLRAEVVLVHLCTLFSLLTKVPSTQEMLRIRVPHSQSSPYSSVCGGWTTIQYTSLLLPQCCHKRGAGCLRIVWVTLVCRGKHAHPTHLCL